MKKPKKTRYICHISLHLSVFAFLFEPFWADGRRTAHNRPFKEQQLVGACDLLGNLN
jgi:hypothetical protein